MRSGASAGRAPWYPRRPGAARIAAAVLPGAFAIGWAAMLALWLLAPGAAGAVELCSAHGRALMRAADIAEAKIEAVCAKAARGSAPLTLDLVRTQPELGYCRVTLALTNNTALYLNALVITAREARFHPFKFHNIEPGGTGYASANSRILLGCDELPALKLALHWPASLRIGDRSPTGRQLQYYRPALLNPLLAWGG